MTTTQQPAARYRVFLDAIGGMSRSFFALRWPTENECRNTLIRRQADAIDRIPGLVSERLCVVWLELRESVDLTPWLGRLDWVILSGSPDTPTDLAWLRRVIADCRAAGVPCWVRNIGAKPYIEHRSGGPRITTVLRGDTNRKTTTWPFNLDVYTDPSEWPEDIRDVREVPKCFLEGE